MPMQKVRICGSFLMKLRVGETVEIVAVAVVVGSGSSSSSSSSSRSRSRTAAAAEAVAVAAVPGSRPWQALKLGRVVIFTW